jgi:hypothetical protein
MKKGQLIYAAILLSILGVFAGVYKFYFEAKLAAYTQDENTKKALEAALDDLEQSFSRTDPEVLTREWRGQTVPWSDAVAARAGFFHWGGWYDHETPPKEGPILKFWYDEECRKMLRKLYEKVGEKMGRYDLFPPDIRQNLNIPTLDDWTNIDVQELEVNRQLGRLGFGIMACDLLLNAKASSINDISLWPPIRQAPEFNKLLTLQTVGMSFTITAKNLVALLEEKVRLADRYFNVNAIRITYPYIAMNVEPNLQVEMLITQAGFVAQARGEGDTGTAGPGPGQQQPSDLANVYNTSIRPKAPVAPPPEPGFFGKAWKWFKRNILVVSG